MWGVLVGTGQHRDTDYECNEYNVAKHICLEWGWKRSRFSKKKELRSGNTFQWLPF